MIAVATTIRRPLWASISASASPSVGERGLQLVLRADRDRVADHRHGVDVDDRVRRRRRRRRRRCRRRPPRTPAAPTPPRAPTSTPAATTSAGDGAVRPRARSLGSALPWRDSLAARRRDVARHRAIGHAAGLQPRGHDAVRTQALLDAGVHERAVAHDGPPCTTVSRATDRAAAQPRLDRVGDGAGERRPGERPHGDVADRARRRARRARRRARGTPRRRASPSPAPSGPCRRRRRRAAWPAASPGGPPATATPRRPTTSRRRRARRATPAARRATTGAMPDARMRLLDGQWATPTPAAPRRRDLVGVGHHAVGEPRPVGQPAGALEVVGRPAAERGQRELVVLGVLGEVGVQPHVEALGQLGRAHHQRPR